MEALNSYLDYRKNKPDYNPWKNSQEEKESKRLAYISKNGISEEEKQENIKRAKAVLNAVDIMDEYSQTRAEDTETAMQPVINMTAQAVSTGSMALGGLALLIKPLRNSLDKIANNKNISKDTLYMAVPLSVAALSAIILSFVTSAWSAKKEVEASRIGRHESMNKELSSANHFAVLTDEQEQQVNEMAKTIKISQKEAKKSVANVSGVNSIAKAFKNIFVKDKDYEKSKAEFENKIAKDKEKFDTVQLSKKQLEEAKKDQQLIFNVVEKIDIASQDYAENIELATNAISTIALGSGGIIGFLTNKIVKNINFKNPLTKKVLPIAIGALSATAICLSALKLQKQGSRIARFKVKQDFLQNPEKLYYVDDEKAKSEDGTKFKKEKEKTNIFKFIIQAFKDNKEYQQYLKENNVEIKQKRAALEKIKLTPEQEKRAKQLQMNIFKTFNRVDDKSQKYAESTEMLGEAALGLASALGSIFPIVAAFKSVKNLKSEVSILKPILKWGAVGLIPPILLDIFITKEQKNASRVADMLAMKELEDIRNFADYSEIEQKPNEVQNESNNASKYLM